MKQISFFKKQKLCFGGSLNVGKRKEARPLSSKHPIHLVLKSEKNNLFEEKIRILRMVNLYSKCFGIKSYGISVQKDHIHFLIRLTSRRMYLRFIRSLTGILSRALQIKWKYLPFTRVAQWGRDFKNGLDYLQKNEQEVLGLKPYEPRRHRYPK